MIKLTKSKANKIIIAIIIVMLCNFVMPNYTFAAGGIIFKYAVPILLLVPDLLVQKLQQIFIDENSDIAIKDPKGGVSNYYIRYSPGVIFSGKVPGLDVNFFSPMGNKFGETIFKWQTYTYPEPPIATEIDSLDKLKPYGFDIEKAVQGVNYSEVDEYVLWFGKDIAHITWTDDNGTPDDVSDDHSYWYHVSTTANMPVILYVLGGLCAIAGIVGIFIPGVGWGFTAGAIKVGAYIIGGTAAADFVVQNISEMLSGGDLYEIVPGPEKKSTRVSIAYTLRNTVATYYKIMQEIALVVLLSVLVYVGIRMMLSSSSKDKAKYKEMFGHWLVAVCILFSLHFFMNIVLTAIQSVNDIFSKFALNTEGADVLMSSIRTNIGYDPQSEDLSSVFSSVIIYLVLAIYTIQYTIIYLKRVIHIAFLTMIAPMVAFTYPIDKMKDGKAQALSLWLKEFSFNSLMQPIHMILYCIFVDGAMGLSTTNPFYAMVIIGFFKPGEKFVRKIFGLEEDSSLGKMASAIGGATLMNSISKLGSKIPKGTKGNGGGNSGGSSGNTKIRTANSGGKDSYEALKKGQKTGAKGNSSETNSSNAKGSRNAITGNVEKNNNNNTTSSQAQKRDIKNTPSRLKGIAKGSWKVARKYVINKNTGKKLLRGGAKVAGAATLGTIGLAAGIATGEPENALAGALGGIAAGNRVGGNLVDGGANMLKGAKDGITGIKDTYKEGQYGQEEYARMKYDAEFKKTKEYKDLTSKYPGQEGNIEEFLNAGITDTSKMGTAMKNIKENKYSTQEAIAYMKLAEKCPDEILYNEESFREYLSSRGIPEGQAEQIRKGIVDFK